MPTLNEIYEILKYIAKKLKENPHHVFYLDEPFVDNRIMDDFHIKLLNINDVYIEVYGRVFEGTSQKRYGVLRLGYRIKILEQGQRLLACPPSRTQE